MGIRSLQLKLPTDYGDEDVRTRIRRELKTDDFTWVTERKSLDARKKSDIHWLLTVLVSSASLPDGDEQTVESLDIPNCGKGRKVVVAGSGPAGFFAAWYLQSAGYEVTLLERGEDVDARSGAISALNEKGHFNPSSNYAFGEGGAGTFSDGKLTSRSKHISKERRFILDLYVKAGAPREILYLAHPHLGTDRLRVIVKNLRMLFEEIGGRILFETRVEDLQLRGQTVREIRSSSGDLEADFVIMATGHSAYDSYRMLMERGVLFRAKNFAIGHRVEHAQYLINRAQWGVESLPGVKAAEYRLTAHSSTGRPVYSFCMCPGGTVVPAGAYAGRSVVNGMSEYARNGRFANAGIVAGVHPDDLLGHAAEPGEILDYMDRLEESFYRFSDGYRIPALSVQDYLQGRRDGKPGPASYPLGLESAALHAMIPDFLASTLREGLRDFSEKLKGFERGQLMGLESKSSSPLQVLRDAELRCDGFENLYVAGEAGGYSGGIISSAADGIRCAVALAGVS